MRIIRVALPVPLNQLFDYVIPDDWSLDVGCRVRVPLGKRKLIGIIEAIDVDTDQSINKLKQALTYYESQPIVDPAMRQLAYWLHQYYHYPLGEIYPLMLPKSLRQGKPLADSEDITSDIDPPDSHGLTDSQQQAISSVLQAQDYFQAYLLQGVTASGKTEVYLQIIQSIISQGRQALVLVPEIGLTPQTLARFEKRLGAHNCVTIHSSVAAKKRLLAWQKARLGQVRVVIGTRSALLTPFNDLGVIILDEEHDLSFKQQDSLRYSARDTAVMRAKQLNIPVVLGSATPSLESLYNAQNKRYQLLSLPERVTPVKSVDLKTIDMRQQTLQEGICAQLLNKLKQHLDEGYQVLLFLNRRGFSPVMLCHSCGYHFKCQRCDVHMTYHRDIKALVCHHCDYRQPLPSQCPSCAQAQIVSVGVGTERLETVLQQWFPDKTIVRFDRDSTRSKKAWNDKLKAIDSGDGDILVGTQMLAKGHHMPNVTLVAILDCDYGFFSGDFRAIERMGQLIMQVAGRAGRGEKAGEVCLQTHQPEHPLLQVLLQKGYTAFADQLLEERRQNQMPPYWHFALLRMEAKRYDVCQALMLAIKQQVHHPAASQVCVLGPVPAPMPKRAGYMRSQLLVTSPERRQLHAYLDELYHYLQTHKTARQVRWSLDVDPQEMI